MAGNQTPMQAVVINQPTMKKDLNAVGLALFNTDGTPASTIKKAPAQADSVAADVATLKNDFNALLAKLRAAGILS